MNTKMDRNFVKTFLLILFTCVLLAVVIAAVSGCTDGDVKQYTTLGSAAHIRCYSGALLIYEGDSTGKIASEHQSDGWFFEDAATHKLVRVSGACVIIN